MRKILLIIITIYLFHTKASCQCEAILPLTDSAMQFIDNPYQLTFLHKHPVNRLDSLVERMINTPMKIDSNYFDWNYTVSKIRPVHDYEKLIKIVDSIGQLKTDEAFCILCLLFILPLKAYDDLKPISNFTYIFSRHGAAVAINKYYLQNQINTELAFSEFQNEVYSKTIEMRQMRFRNLTYCKPFTGDALLLYNMQQINPNVYDNSIKKIIEKYLSHQRIGHSYKPDSILLEVLRLPFVTDAEWDTELERTLKTPSFDRLGVIIHDKKKGYSMERIYKVLTTPTGFSRYTGAEYGIRFIENVRQQLEKEEMGRLNQKEK